MPTRLSLFRALDMPHKTLLSHATSFDLCEHKAVIDLNSIFLTGNHCLHWLAAGCTVVCCLRSCCDETQP